MYDYQITKTVAQTRRQDLLARAEAERVAKASRTPRAASAPRTRRGRSWAWLEYRPAVRAFTGAR